MTDHNEIDCGCTEYRDLSRRSFIQTTAGATGALAAAAAFPNWLPKVVLAKNYTGSRDVMVSVFQRGGVDGLSTCVPFAENAYYTSRPTIAIPRPDDTSVSAALRGIALDNFFAFPPAMAGLIPAYTATDLLVVHATGLLDKSRSHFDAQRWMEVGKKDITTVTGWLGRHLATVPPTRTDALLRGLGIGAGLAKSLVGGPKTLPIADPANYSVGGAANTRASRLAVIENNYALTPDPLKTNALNAVNTIELLGSLNFNGYVPQNGAVYPNTGFGRAMRAVAVLIKADVGLEAAQIDVGGWDTHSAQDPNGGSMRNTMADFANALGAFWRDVIAMGYPATAVSVSEFGRNLRENGSAGTDHGRGTTMFAMGKGISGGRVLSTWPGLANLEDGQDLRVTIDYRDILAEIVANRLDNAANVGMVFPGWTPTFRGVTR
jgi:uncharacterized protein (DUF1501 family)